VTTEERAAEALEHAQAAALELIAALRSALDVAEELVRDPAPLVAAVASAGEALGPLLDGLAPLIARGREAASGRPAATDGPEGPTRRPRVQHIRVS
jgi:hypothetical protein